MAPTAPTAAATPSPPAGLAPGRATTGRSRRSGRLCGLLTAAAVLVPLAACSAVGGGVGGGVAGSATPASAVEPTRSSLASGVSTSPEPTRRPRASAAAPTWTAVPRSTATAGPTDATSPAGPSAPAGKAAWTWVVPDGLQTWVQVADDGTTVVRRSGGCLVLLSVLDELPSTTDEDLARQHLRLTVEIYQRLLAPTVSPSGKYVATALDPLRLEDPTRTAPPTVHLQLSGFDNVVPDLGLTDRTYAFATDGGGPGLAVSTACADSEFATRYDTEIAPLISDLGVDTGI